MINITVVAAGNLKEAHFRAAAAEYIKMLSAFARVTVTEVADDTARIIAAIPERAYKIALCVEGAEMSSEEFASRLERLATDGNSSFVFIIGGSDGLDEKIKKMCGLRLSFSPMTFPHRLMRVILLEQIYRAYTIINNKTYHK